MDTYQLRKTEIGQVQEKSWVVFKDFPHFSEERKISPLCPSLKSRVKFGIDHLPIYAIKCVSAAGRRCVSVSVKIRNLWMTHFSSRGGLPRLRIIRWRKMRWRRNGVKTNVPVSSKKELIDNGDKHSECTYLTSRNSIFDVSLDLFKKLTSSLIQCKYSLNDLSLM